MAKLRKNHQVPGLKRVHSYKIVKAEPPAGRLAHDRSLEVCAFKISTIWCTIQQYIRYLPTTYIVKAGMHSNNGFGNYLCSPSLKVPHLPQQYHLF